jgi:hypothetical protein
MPALNASEPVEHLELQPGDTGGNIDLDSRGDLEQQQQQQQQGGMLSSPNPIAMPKVWYAPLQVMALDPRAASSSFDLSSGVRGFLEQVLYGFFCCHIYSVSSFCNVPY